MPVRAPSLAFSLLLLAAPLTAQGTRLLRQPTVSQTQIAFVYASDIWIASREGGEARRVTSFQGVEERPRFSPDGKWIAFTGEYGGNRDVYLVPTAGGEPKRLTWHPGDDEVQGWTPDGAKVVFASGRTGAPVPYPTLWTVPVAGGMEEKLAIPRAWKGVLSPDGASAAYAPHELLDAEWRNYRGGQASPIWIQRLSDGSLEKTPFDGSRQMDPVWLGSGIYYISEKDYAANVYRYEPATKAVTQLTRLAQFDAKNLSGGAGALVYDAGGYLHLLDPATGKDQQLAITVQGDLPWARPRWIDVAPSFITNAALSPTGARAVFEARGEIFTVPAEKGDVRNLTRSSGAADRRPIWSPDGKLIAWFTDRSGEYQLAIGSPDGLTPPREIPLPGPTYYFTPAWSPDSKHLAFTDEGLNLHTLDVASGKITKVDTDTYMQPERTMEPKWSPDSKWLAYSKRLDSQFHVLIAYSLADGKRHQLTDGLSDAVQPAWDASGKYLYFLASTDYALASGWVDMSNFERPNRRSPYVMVLRKTDPSPFLPESDEEKVRDTASAKPAAPKPAGPDSAVTVRIDLDGLSQRILALNLPPRSYAQLEAGKAGVVFIAEAVQGQPGMTVQRYELAKRRATPFLSGVTALVVSQDGGKVLYGSGPTWGIVPAEGPAPPKVGDGKLNLAFSMHLDPKAEWRQIFREAWRLQRDFIYVDNLHGADWAKVLATYEPLVEHVAHRNDLNTLLDVVGGELSLGHTFVFGGDLPKIDSTKVGLLGADYTVDQGRYRISRIYSGENWNPGLRSPLSEPGVDVAQSDYLLAVNGVELRAPTNLYSVFEATAGKQTVIRVNGTPSLAGSREVTVVPVASEQGLRTFAWVEGNRRKVDSLSSGRIAYVYLPNTSVAGYTFFNRYYFAQQNKQGVVLDERFNGGGSVADYIVDIVARKLHGYFNNAVGERRPFTSPGAGIWGPKVMVINESAGSGGDMLPFMFRHMQLGPLVGTKTWGGLVGTWDVQPFVDGGAITNPRGGYFSLEGDWGIENVGIAPDIEVEQTPKEVLAGRDPQLERAVQEALALLAKNPVKLLAEPPPPVRVRRPR
jgi:tricorn protease